MYLAVQAIYRCHAIHSLPTNTLLSYNSQWNRNRLLEFQMNSSYDHGCRDHQQSITATLAYLADNDATDPRDRVYSLSGLVRDFHLCGNPSYAMSVDELYANLVLAFNQEYRSLDVICFATIFNKAANERTLPSWVPDWRTKLTPLVVPLLVSQGAKDHIGNLRPCTYSKVSACYAASCDLQPKVSFTIDKRIMICTGHPVTAIKGLSRLPPEMGKDEVDRTREVTPVTIDQRRAVDPTALLESMLRCLVSNRGDRYLNHAAPMQRYIEEFSIMALDAMTNFNQLLPWFVNWLELNANFQVGETMTLRELLEITIEPDKLTKHTLSDLSPRRGFAERFHETMVRMQRRLVRCADGKLATVPLTARKDDVGCVLLGCSVPVVLREVESNVYEFIGECYVDGIMDGEALETGIERQFSIR